MTFNQFIKLFLDIANAHNDIRGFGNGPFHEYMDSEIASNGVAQNLWVSYENTPIQGGVKSDKFTLYVLDFVNKDVTNRNNVLSDTKRTMEDIISVLNNPYYYDFFEVDNNVDIKPIYDEKTVTEECGVYCEITLKQDFDYDSCEANVTGLPIAGGTSIAVDGFTDTVIDGYELILTDEIF